MKDLFDDNYFAKHRSKSETAKDGNDLSKYLNIKRAPREEVDIENLEEVEDIEEIQEVARTETPDWKIDFLKNIIAGFAGGFVVLVFSMKYFLGLSFWAPQFWNIIVAILIVFSIFFFILGLILRR